jgi:hypothetical protein
VSSEAKEIIMSYEPTSTNNPHQLTVKQHFHMKAVLRRFEGPEGIRVTRKLDGAVSYHEANDPIFLSKRAWSQEGEADISHPIEIKFDREVKRIEREGVIVMHDAISRYHLLWTLRYGFAKDPSPEQQVYPNDIGGKLPIDLEEWLEANRKVPIRGGGTVAGRFITSIHLRQDLVDPQNLSNYEGIVWNLMRSDEAALISADCYADGLLMVVSPRFALIGSKEPRPLNILSAAEADELNLKSLSFAQEFTIG